MGSGCFGPSPKLGNIDIEVLQQIYEQMQATQVVAAHSSYSLSESDETYRNLKQKISKQGKLKKLCDYLSCHRFRICDNLMHNLRIVTQSKNLVHKYVAIIILDKLISIAPEQIDNKNLNQSLKTIQTTKQSYAKQTTSGIHNKSKNILTVKRLLTQPQHIQTNNSLLLQQITSFRFEEIYLNLVVLLLKQNSQIYSLALQNLIKYCKLSKGTFKKIQTAQEILKIVHDSIQSGIQIKNNLQAFDQLTQRVNNNFYTKNMHYFQTFVQIEIQNQQSFSHSEYVQKTTGFLCQNICSKYLYNCTDTNQFRELFSIFIYLMDRHQFQNVDVLQRLLFDMIYEHQLKTQYARNLFSMFLSYLAFPFEHHLQSTWSAIYMEQNPTQFKNKYRHIISIKTKLNCLSKVSKWLNYHLIIDIDEVLYFHGRQLTQTFIFNLLTSCKQLSNKSVNQMINLADHLKKQQKILLILQLIGALSDQHLRQQQKFTVLAVCTRIIQRQNQIIFKQNPQNIWLRIDSQQCLQVNKKIMSFNCKLFSKLSIDQIRYYADKICEYFISLNSYIKNKQISLMSKTSLINHYNSSIIQIGLKYEGLLMAYIENLQTIIIKQTTQYSLLYHILIISTLQATNCQTAAPQLGNFTKILKLKQEQKISEMLRKYQQNKIYKNYQEYFQHHHLQLYDQCQNYFQTHQLTDMNMLMSGFGGVRSILSMDSCANKQQDDRNLQHIIQIIKN